MDDRIRALFLQEGAETDSNLQFVRDMLTRKAFDREAVLGVYHEIRRGRRVPDQELDQVASWLKLSGVVSRRDGLLRVRNAVYEAVFDERWTRDHLRLNVNWRRRLVRVATVLLVLTVLVTIPLAGYAWRQKTEAEYQARQAGLERDEATRQRVIAENSMNERNAALETAQKPLDELKRIAPGSAAAIESQVARERAEAQKVLADAMATLREERDDALRRVAALESQRTPVRDNTNARPEDPAAAARRAAAARQVQDEIDVRRVLRAYEAAYASRSVDALSRVQALSSAETRTIRTQFADVRAYRVTIDKDDIRVSADGRQAIVTAQVYRSVTVQGRTSTNGVEVFTMEKRGGGWIILNVRPADTGPPRRR